MANSPFGPAPDDPTSGMAAQPAGAGRPSPSPTAQQHLGPGQGSGPGPGGAPYAKLQQMQKVKKGVGAHTSQAALQARSERAGNFDRLMQGEAGPVLDQHLDSHISDAANYVKSGAKKGSLSGSSIRRLHQQIEQAGGLPISLGKLRRELNRRGASVAGD